MSRKPASIPSFRAATLIILLTALGLAVAIPVAIVVGSESSVAASADAKPSETTGARDSLRAFYTAPPVVPHMIQGQGNKQCAYCHTEVRHIGERTTVPSPHLEMSNCQQCHVGPHLLNDGLAVLPVATDWKGLAEPREGSRAHPLAPPTIPHRLFLREKCLTCHDPEKPETGMRVEHPERSNCMQCHVADAAAQF